MPVTSGITKDFRTKLIKYLTGKYDVEQGDNKPTFINPFIKQNDLYTYIQTELQTSSQIFLTDSIQGKNSEITLIYGTYIKDTKDHGFMLLVDKNFTPIKILTEFTSGVEFGKFYKINVDESGNFFAIEKKYDDNVKRFLMLNNITLNLNNSDYEVKIRRAYNLQEQIVNAIDYTNLVKSVGQSKYLIVGYITQSGYERPIATELTVNVGSANEWVDYIFSNVNEDVITEDVWTNWDEQGNLIFKIIGYDINNKFYEFYKDGSTTGYYEYPLTYSGNKTALIIDKDTTYIGISNQDDENNNIYIYTLKNRIPTLIYERADTKSFYSNFIKLKKIDKEVFIGLIIYEDNNSTFNYVGRIFNDNVYLGGSKGQTVETDKISFRILSVNKQYNLYNYYLQNGNYVTSDDEIFNEFNYNGEDYQSLDSMVPNSANLYDNSGLVIFSRNLYNKSVNGNRTISTLEIPNTMLNDINIYDKELISKTNTKLVVDSDTFNKNIYETVDINFYNTILISNNNTEENIQNLEGATRLNKSVSDLTDYSSTKGTKLKINYSDNTYYIRQLDVNSEIEVIDDYTVMYDFNIYVSKEINNIQIISQDENTVYQTIEGTFEQNKYYSITQMVNID